MPTGSSRLGRGQKALSSLCRCRAGSGGIAHGHHPAGLSLIPQLFGVPVVLKQTTFETSQTDTHGVGSARSLRLKSSSQKNPSQYCDTALMRHTFRNECTEANFGARIRYSDNVSGPLPTSTVVLPNCVHRPVHQVGISIPKGRNGPAPSGIARRARPAGQRYCAAAGLRGTNHPTESGRHRDEIATHATAYGRAPRRIRQRSNVAAGKLDTTVRQLALDIP